MSKNDIKPVAWRYKDFNPVLADGYAYGYTHDPESPVKDEPLYDQSAIDRLTAERDFARKESLFLRSYRPIARRLNELEAELAGLRAERDAAAAAYTRLFAERQP